MIRFENVSKRYDGSPTLAVHSVSMTVEEGEFVVLLGSSGCGKTTTLKMVNRLIEPTAGTIFLGEQNVMEQDPVLLRRGIGYVIQSVGLFPHMTIAENVAVVPRLLGWTAERTQSRVRELLEMVHLPADEFVERMPSQLSGGQRQRVGFARALAGEPQVMLLDEPFGALDPITRDSLQGELKQIVRQLNLTCVMVTHDMTEALLMADRIAVMAEGKVVQLATPAELLQSPANEYVASLMDAPRRQAAVLDSLSATSAADG